MKTFVIWGAVASKCRSFVWARGSISATVSKTRKTFAVLDAAVENGIDFFDTADVYAAGKAEEVMGRWMKNKDRRTLTVATKCRGRMWPGSNGEGLSRKHILDACHDSLRRLDTDYIDLYQIHCARLRHADGRNGTRLERTDRCRQSALHRRLESSTRNRSERRRAFAKSWA